MRIKAIFEGTLAGLIAALLSYGVLISPATLAAVAIRTRMPQPWFSGLITWYAAFAVIGVSIVAGALAGGSVYRHLVGSVAK